MKVQTLFSWMKKPHLTFHRHAAFLGELFLLLWHLLNSVRLCDSGARGSAAEAAEYKRR